jgi:hypothetical protein
MGGTCSEYGGGKRLIQGFGEKTWGKRPFERPRRRWEDIKMYPQEVGCWGVDCIELAQERDRWWAHVTTVMSLRVP